MSLQFSRESNIYAEKNRKNVILHMMHMKAKSLQWECGNSEGRFRKDVPECLSAAEKTMNQLKERERHIERERGRERESMPNDQV